MGRRLSLLRQHRFIFMLNTSISDTLTGYGIFYQFLFDVREGYQSKNSTYYALYSLLGVNIMTFLFAEFDRYFAICHPFFYDRFINTGVIICVNLYCLLHVYGLLLIQQLVPLSIAIQISVYSRICLMVVIVIKITMTAKLVFVARYQIQREPPGPKRDSKKESLLIIVMVVMLFSVLWGPSLFYVILSLLTGKYLIMKNEAVNPVNILARTNALCTPSIYLWASPSLKNCVLLLQTTTKACDIKS